MEKHDLVIIGGGVGGLVTASVAGQLGLDVVLIERREMLGGDCLNAGCVPSKSLIRGAEVAHLMRTANRFGVSPAEPQVDLGTVMDRVHAVIAHLAEHDDPERLRGYGVDVRFGEAQFTDPYTVTVDGEPIAGRRFVIATGSRPAAPPIPGLESASCWTNETVFNQRTLPERLAVIGGGPIGTELAQAFSRLGSQVTILQGAPYLLPKEDRELTAELEERFAAEGITVHAGATVERVETEQGVSTLHVQGPDKSTAVLADAILLGTGRHANVEALNLDAAGVALDEGRIRVDRRMRTTARHIFACGDCCGPYPFTHMAEYQAGIVIANAIFRMPKKADYRVVPRVTYTAPELAHVGYTEAEAEALGKRVQVARFPFRDVDRAVCDGQPEGQVKLILARGRLIGASVLGAHGGELIHELILAMHAKVKVGGIAAAIHAYPTRSQIHRRAVNSLYAPRLYAPGTRRLVRWLNWVWP